MRKRLGLPLVLLCMCGATAQAQDAASCHGATPAITSARQALGKDPSSLAALITLADALTSQSCYNEAIHVLEEGQELHPQDAVLDARLRSARSSISEQNYIESVTRAEESARLQRNIMRCRRLGDIGACDEALSVQRNDPDLLAARAAATAQTQASLPASPASATESPAGTADTSIPPPAPALVASAMTRPKRVVYSNEAPVSRSN